MSYSITSEDKQLSFSRFAEVALKLQVLNADETILDEITCITEYGSLNIDSSSHVRRTFYFTLIPTDPALNIGEQAKIWINKLAKLYVGMKTPRMSDYKWYPCGAFIYTDASSSYNATDNSLSVNCGDKYKQLDGTQNGELGALITTIPAYEADQNGNPIKYNVIRDILITIITQLGNINNYVIDDIGEYKGMAQYNPEYAVYRTNHPRWNCVPYDLEYSVGSYVSNIIEEITSLYPNYDACFDENGVFTVGMIPNCTEDDVILTNDEIQPFLLSESCTTDLTTIRNVVHVWGETFEVDWYSDNVKNSNQIYTATIDKYSDDYMNGDLIAIKVPETNASTQYINVNGIESIQIFDENTDKALSANSLVKNTVYVFKFRKTYHNGSWIKRFYLLGQWQAHGLCALVDGTISDTLYTCSDGTSTPLYSKQYFQDKYKVETVTLKVIKDSPYTVQKIGERLSAKADGEYANITSDSLAAARAEYELYKSSMITDNVTITINALLPWLSEYSKVSYVKKNEEIEKQYITDKISLNFSEGTTSITMYTFVPLYENN